MNLGEWLGYKFRAARTLGRMVRWLSNWQEVWSCYRSAKPLPALRFRSGLTLHHGPNDSPIALLHEVFGDRQYRRHLHGRVEGVMIDLGANLGAVSLDWVKRSKNLLVHAYEPNPSTNAVLRRNVEANGMGERITVHDEAVGRGQGQLSLRINNNSMTTTAYSEGAPLSADASLRVQLIDLDEVVRRAGGGPVSLLKMDTEGAEADTLDGASPTTLQAIRQVILEYHAGLCPDAAARCKKTLEQAGFQCLVRPINRAHGMMYAWRAE